MRTLPMILLGFAGCGGGGIDPVDSGLPPFDPAVVVYADGCTPVPEAMPCIEANPVEFLNGGAAQTSRDCEALGYTCCDTNLWISTAAASCIAEQDERFSAQNENTITMTCYPDVFGPMYNVYEYSAIEGGQIGIGVHAATGRVTWFDNGSGVFS